jgi:hypothetical protein
VATVHDGDAMYEIMKRIFSFIVGEADDGNEVAEFVKRNFLSKRAGLEHMPDESGLFLRTSEVHDVKIDVVHAFSVLGRSARFLARLELFKFL